MPPINLKRSLPWVVALLMTACVQEIQKDTRIPIVTSIYPTETPLLPTPEPVTPTPAFPPPVPLASGPVNLIVIGDDLARGVGDDIGRGYPGRLLELVSQIRPNSAVVNFAQPGWTSDDVIHGKGDFSGQLPRAVGEVRSAYSQGRGAMALVWIGGNDLWELYSGTDEVTVLDEEADITRFSRNIETILVEIRQTEAAVVVALLDDQSLRPARTRADAYPDITAEELDRMSAQVQRYNAIISQLAQTYSALTVDFYGSEIFTSSATLARDGYHPNSAGYDIIAQAWYKAIIPLLP
jgi:lysophospholipase L1-like esterase